MYETLNTENVVNVYKQLKFNFILKAKVASVRSLVEWPIELNSWWSMKMTMYFKDEKQGSKKKKTFLEIMLWSDDLGFPFFMASYCYAYYTAYCQKSQ